jgi:Ca2+-binding RTX toxin-like protein
MFDLKSTIQSIVQGVEASADFKALIAGLQTDSVHSLFSRLDQVALDTIARLSLAPTSAKVSAAINTVQGLDKFAQAIVKEDILPDVTATDTQATVLQKTFLKLNTLIATLAAQGVDTSTFPSIDQATAAAYVLGLSFNPSFNLVNNVSTITGTSNANSLVNVRAGKFTISGQGGNDLIGTIGLGHTKLYGDDGNDLITHIGRANSSLYGGAGADWMLNVGALDNSLFGGEGDDTLINIGAGRNNVRGENGNDTLINYGTGNDNILSGGSGNDRLIHFGGNARLIGNAGDDILIGSKGNDEFIGGGGDDLLAGGAGADTFFLNLTVNVRSSGMGSIISSAGVDTIVDFSTAELDVLHLTVRGTGSTAVSGSTLSFDAMSSELSFGGKTFAVLSGVSSFDTNNVQVVYA